MLSLQQKEVISDISTEFITETFKQTTVPKTPKHQKEDDRIDIKCKGINVYDASLIYNINYSPIYEAKAKELITWSDLVILTCNPYLYPCLEPYLKDKLFIYDAHDVAYSVKTSLLSNVGHYKKKFLKDQFEVEKACCDRATLILTCSENDKNEIAEIFNIIPDKILVVPNGVDMMNTFFTGVPQRILNKEKLGIRDKKIGIFLGSAHPPNFDACDSIINFAYRCPETYFFLIGSQCTKYERISLPNNVGLLGMVNESVKNSILGIADFSVNPICSGSGTNVKMFDYMACGIPIISTLFATRGIENKDSFIICDIKEMPVYINQFDLSNQTNRVLEAYTYVKEYFNWDKIVKETLYPKLNQLL